MLESTGDARNKGLKKWFGSYTFHNVDSRGNKIYHKLGKLKHSKDQKIISKDKDEYWWVSFE